MRFVVFFVLMVFLNGSVFGETIKVKSGDTVYSFLKEYFKPVDINEIYQQILKLQPDFVLKKGSEVEIVEDKIIIRQDVLSEIVIGKKDSAVDVKVLESQVLTLKTIVNGVIKESLFSAVAQAGEDQELASAIADIFEGEIDFFKDIRRNDYFNVLVEKKFAKGQFIGYGRILGADFKNNGILYRAFYYEDEEISGYFTKEGDSFKKGFLKAPLKFGRISSKFTAKRVHPVTSKVKAHFGVDYAAAYGTPVHATADGKIIRRGYDSKGGGNFVKIRHSNGYDTTYMHFSKFAGGQKVGSRVKQGEVIGYVGSTGYATGPHVDYRISRNGKYINPLRFKSPSVKLPKSKLQEFSQFIEQNYSALNNAYTKISNFMMVE